MAVIDPITWQTWAKTTLAGDALAQVTSICSQVDTAIHNYLKRTLEISTYSIIRSAPRTAKVQLFRYSPIQISGFQVWLNPRAKGDPSQFDDSNLLTMYQDYLLEASRDDDTVSKNCIVQFLQGGPWGVGYYQPPYSVASKRVNIPGALKFSFTGGYDTIPADITLAACLAVSKIKNMPRYGMMETSESWNGYSYALPTGLMMMGILGDTQIASLLEPYMNYADMVG